VRFTLHLPAQKGDRYTKDSWDHNKGKSIPLTAGAGPQVIMHATVIDTRVVSDGSAVEVTLEVNSEISTLFNPVKRDVMGAEFVAVPKFPGKMRE
jgi:hypothetical protein